MFTNNPPKPEPDDEKPDETAEVEAEVIAMWREQGMKEVETYLEKQLAFSIYWENWSKPEED